MDAFQQMRLHEDELTPTEHRVYEAVVESPESFLQSSTTIVARQFGVSQSAVSRFCQKVGFDSFGDFQMNLMLTLSTNTPAPPGDAERDPVEYLCDMTRATRDAVGAATIQELVERTLSARSVFTTGGGLSEPPALMLSMVLLKYNVACHFVPAGQDMLNMHVAGPDDLLVIFSSKNDSQRMVLSYLQDRPRERRPHTVMVSHSATHPLRKSVDEFVLLPTWQTERYPVYIEPMTSMLAFCSIFMMGVSQATGHDPEPLGPIVNGRSSSWG